MASLTDTIQELFGNVDPNDLTDKQWEIVSEAMKRAQEQSYAGGERTGIVDGQTPTEQAKKDRENPNLADPFREGGGPEEKE